jgi:hypothetical protein
VVAASPAAGASGIARSRAAAIGQSAAAIGSSRPSTKASTGGASRTVSRAIPALLDGAEPSQSGERAWPIAGALRAELVGPGSEDEALRRAG